MLVCIDEGLQETCDGGLSISVIFCSKFQRGSCQFLSPTIPTVLARRSSAPSGAQRECSHRKSALKAVGSLGDEDCIVKRKRCHRKANELLGEALSENNVGNTPYHFNSTITINPTASRIKERKDAYVILCNKLQ